MDNHNIEKRFVSILFHKDFLLCLCNDICLKPHDATFTNHVSSDLNKLLVTHFPVLCSKAHRPFRIVSVVTLIL